MKYITKRSNGYSPYDLNSVAKKFDTKYSFPTNRHSLSQGYSLVDSGSNKIVTIRSANSSVHIKKK